MKEKLKAKIKSYKFWVSLSAAIVLLVEAIGKAVGFLADSSVVNDIVMGLCGVLIVLGIVTDDVPKKKEETKEEENKEDRA